MASDHWKARAAERALDYVKPGMKIGLGTGSTAALFTEYLARRAAEGLDVVCVPTSEATRALAERAGLRLTTLDEHSELDLTVDGADEIDGKLRLIKGGGGALLREKIVAMASDRMIVIADHSKRVDKLGAFPLPVEIVSFGAKATLRMIAEACQDAGCNGAIRLRQTQSAGAFVTDNGNLIADCVFGAIKDPEALGDVLEMVPGVVEHGLFVGIADIAIIGGPDDVHIISAGDD